jgi:hypothetical protein
MFSGRVPREIPATALNLPRDADFGVLGKSWHEFCKHRGRAQRLGLAPGDATGNGERPAPGPGRLASQG